MRVAHIFRLPTEPAVLCGHVDSFHEIIP